MSFQILPNWCKKLGLIIFFACSFLIGGDAFMDGSQGVPDGTHHYFRDLYGPFLFHVFEFLPIMGMLIYLFSKEKIEDDYLKFLRLESYQITAIVFLLIATLIFFFKTSLKLPIELFLFGFLLLYFLVFFVKKRTLE